MNISEIEYLDKPAYSMSSVSLDGWHVGGDLSYMFSKSSKLDFDLSNWTITNPTNMDYMFQGLVEYRGNGLSALTISSNTSFSAYRMFAWNYNLGN